MARPVPTTISLIENRMEKITEELESLKLRTGLWKLVPRKSDISISNFISKFLHFYESIDLKQIRGVKKLALCKSFEEPCSMLIY